jgi:pyrroloquinoline quinone (PQQ) biosynthesis protein C
LKKEEILNHEPMIPMQMALHYWDNISRTKPWIEAFAGIGGLELNLHRDLANRYGQKPLVSLELWEPLNLPPEALTHWVAADAADPDEAGHGEETLKILCEYANNPEQQTNVLATLKQSLSVFRYVYDQIGRAAIDATAQASRNKK